MPSSPHWYLASYIGSIAVVDSATGIIKQNVPSGINRLYAISATDTCIATGGDSSPVVQLYRINSNDKTIEKFYSFDATSVRSSITDDGDLSSVSILLVAFIKEPVSSALSAAASGGTLLFVGNSLGDLQLWSLHNFATQSPECRRVCYFNHQSCINGLAVSRDGTRFASSDDTNVYVWSLLNVAAGDAVVNAPLQQFRPDEQYIFAVVFGASFVGAASDTAVYLFDLESGETRARFDASLSWQTNDGDAGDDSDDMKCGFRSLVLSDNERFLLAGSLNFGSITVIDTLSRTVLSTVSLGRKVPAPAIWTMVPLDENATAVAVCCGERGYIIYPALGRVTRVFSGESESSDDDDSDEEYHDEDDEDDYYAMVIR